MRLMRVCNENILKVKPDVICSRHCLVSLVIGFQSCCVPRTVRSRVARWFIFEPKTPYLVKFWRALDRKMFTYLFYDLLKYFTDILRAILWPLGNFCVHLVHFSVLVSCTKKNLATLVRSIIDRQEFFSLDCHHFWNVPSLLSMSVFLCPQKDDVSQCSFFIISLSFTLATQATNNSITAYM
jgi:hypothetical protein